MKTIYMEYRVDNVLADAYSMKLASADGLYGIKKQDGTVVVLSGTSVDNPSTGVYEYSFEEEADIEYSVSWEVIPNSGDNPSYTVQTLGPFYSSSPIKSVADIRGSFVQGTTGTLVLSLTDIHGNALTAESVTLTVSRLEETILDSVEPHFIKAGFYALDWSVASDLDVGEYFVTWSYSYNGYSGTEVQSIIVSASGDTSQANIMLYSEAMNSLRTALNEMICCAQRIPVYHEEAIPDIYNKKYKLTFSRWNQAFGTRIFRNNKLIEEGIEINYFRGTVIFNEAQSVYDTIYADYNFRWFSDEQLDRFLENAIFVVNIYPPQTNYSLFNYPSLWIPAILYGAAKDALREMMMCLNFQQPQQVFGGSDAAQKAFSNMETLKKNYEEELTRLLEQKKRGAYPRSKAIVTPEFTLPGGRSRWFRDLFKGG